jgi:hypothetical protein
MKPMIFPTPVISLRFDFKFSTTLIIKCNCLADKSKINTNWRKNTATRRRKAYAHTDTFADSFFVVGIFGCCVVYTYSQTSVKANDDMVQ